MSKVAIIGGGAAGIVAAIYAAQNNEVTIIEKNNNCAKKILATGNGHCNYFNAFIDVNNYNKESHDFLKNIITIKNKQEVLSFFEKIGIIPNIKNGYFYPYSDQAKSIKDALIKEAINNKVNFINNARVDSIEKNKNKFYINFNNETLYFDKVILSTGSYASIKKDLKKEVTGYKIAKYFGHSINKVLPALVSLKIDANYSKKWAGIRCHAKLNLYENDKFTKSSSGQLQLTDYGISGICTFDLSRLVSKGLSSNNKEEITINFLPFLNFETEEEYYLWLENRNKLVSNRNIYELFTGLLNNKLIDIILKQSNINEDITYNDLTKQQKKNLLQNLIGFRVNIVDTNGFENAQVCTGGIDTKEIDYNTFESKKCKDLYIIGEMLDVDGICGGYNLAFAWLSGMLAGKNI